MSDIVAALPDSLVLVIREYTLDMDLRISLLLLILQERFGATGDDALANLLRTFTITQLRPIGRWMMQFYREDMNSAEIRGREPYFANTIYDGPRQIRLPTITYRWGHTTRTYGSPTPYNSTERCILHPAHDHIKNFISKCNPKRSPTVFVGKAGLVHALNDALSFLRFTSIYDVAVDQAFRNQAYRLLAGTIIYERTLKSAKKTPVTRVRKTKI